MSLVEGHDFLIAYPSGKGSGAITSFAQADQICASKRSTTGAHRQRGRSNAVHAAWRAPDLVIVCSHCTGLDLVTAPLARAGPSVRSIAVGSLGGLAAARRGECDPRRSIVDQASETYNETFMAAGLELVPGYRSMQGIVFRAGDKRFEGLRAHDAVRAALADPTCIMVSRNQGAGTDPDRSAAWTARPDGKWIAALDNAVAAAVAQHCADWGMTIAPVAHAAGLGTSPWLKTLRFRARGARRQRPAVQAFLDSLASRKSRGVSGRSFNAGITIRSPQRA